MFKANINSLLKELNTEIDTEIENLAVDVMAGSAHYDTTDDNRDIDLLINIKESLKEISVKLNGDNNG